MRFSSLLMQLLIGISISRYLAAKGTAGLSRILVSGNSRVPRPPPRIREMVSRMVSSFLFIKVFNHPSVGTPAGARSEFQSPFTNTFRNIFAPAPGAGPPENHPLAAIATYPVDRVAARLVGADQSFEDFRIGKHAYPGGDAETRLLPPNAHCCRPVANAPAPHSRPPWRPSFEFLEWCTKGNDNCRTLPSASGELFDNRDLFAAARKSRPQLVRDARRPTVQQPSRCAAPRQCRFPT